MQNFLFTGKKEILKKRRWEWWTQENDAEGFLVNLYSSNKKNNKLAFSIIFKFKYYIFFSFLEVYAYKRDSI